MPKFINVSSQGDLELPAIGRVIGAGEEFEVDAVLADQLSAQPDVWQLVVKEK